MLRFIIALVLAALVAAAANAADPTVWTTDIALTNATGTYVYVKYQPRFGTMQYVGLMRPAQVSRLTVKHDAAFLTDVHANVQTRDSADLRYTICVASKSFGNTGAKVVAAYIHYHKETGYCTIDPT